MLSIEPSPFISVIVPTYNRADMLGVTLASLFSQSYDHKSYEIVVVDNNSSDNTKEVIEEWQKKATVPLKYVFEPRQGVHYARNTAFNHTKGEILYYTDDDMIADIDLLKEIVKPFSYDSKVASVSGRVLPKWEQEPPQWVLDLCINGWLSLQDREECFIISPHDVGVYSCHQAMRRDAFRESGGFNPENTAGEWIGDGETGLNIKLRELGYWFGYIRTSITYHMIPAQRMTQTYLNRRLANQGNCDSYTDYRRLRYTRLRLIKRVCTHVQSMTIQALKFLVNFCLAKSSWRLNRARIDYYRNRIRYDIRLMTDDNWRQVVMKNDWLSVTESKT